MSVKRIRNFPDTLLSQPCEPVSDFGTSLHDLIQDLKDTMYAGPGVGLAAPQIGVLKQVSVIDVGRRPASKGKEKEINHGLLILINPVLVHGEGQQIPREGCLSVPDFLANVRRHEKVQVRTIDFNRKQFIINSFGFEALALQHEIDHLQGILFLDRVENVKTDIFRRKTYG